MVNVALCWIRVCRRSCRNGSPRLPRRTGFGTTGPRVDAVVGKNWTEYPNRQLDSDPEADPGARDTDARLPADPAVSQERRQSAKESVEQADPRPDARAARRGACPPPTSRSARS